MGGLPAFGLKERFNPRPRFRFRLLIPNNSTLANIRTTNLKLWFNQCHQNRTFSGQQQRVQQRFSNKMKDTSVTTQSTVSTNPSGISRRFLRQHQSIPAPVRGFRPTSRILNNSDNTVMKSHIFKSDFAAETHWQHSIIGIRQPIGFRQRRHPILGDTNIGKRPARMLLQCETVAGPLGPRQFYGCYIGDAIHEITRNS